MTQLSIFQIAGLLERADPIVHFILLSAILVVVFEAAVLLGNLLGTNERGRRG